jgi:lysophospholipase L1-like esterase
MGQSYYPDQAIIDNNVAMCELAEAAGIKVLLCSITPVAHYMPIPDQDAGPRIVELNRQLKAYADSHKNVTYVDYHTPLADAELGLPETGSYDGVHPAVNLYDDMERILVDSVKKVLKLKKQDFYTLPSDEADVRKAESDADRKARNMPMNFKGMVEMMSRMRMR